MRKSSSHYLIIGLIFAIGCALYWLLPISGKLAYIPESPSQINSWPQVAVAHPHAEPFELIVQDATPWSFVHLELAGTTPELLSHGEQNGAGVWEWRWAVHGTPAASDINLYHSCDTGCERWGVSHLPLDIDTPPADRDLIPTKLGIVFANPERNWHGRQGWDVEITYAQLAEEEFWGIDDLVKRVQQAEANGLRVLIRVEYDQGQNVPPPDDFAALDSYLRYVQRIARDKRLDNVYGLIIGSNFNTHGGNSQSADRPVTAEWYARVFNGYGADPALHNNAVEVIRNENKLVRVLVGPVAPWNSDQTGRLVHTVDVPWLNYFNSVVSYIDQAAAEKAVQGISDAAPDGFAIQAFGRVNAPDLSPTEKAQEPLIDLRRAEWGDAQAGFRIYLDWLAVINRYAQTAGKPVYINASNTFDGETGELPAENYPAGWLTHALTAVNAEPQVQMLGWFMDGFPHDEQWAMFSLTTPRGLLIEAAQEFDTLLQAE